MRSFSIAVLTAVAAFAAAAPAAADTPPAVSVRSADGVYTVEARFDVDAPASTVRAVLIDYEGIPRFMPDVRKSVVRERNGTRVLVEQEAVSKVLMFSKTVHLLLEVTEGAHAIAFRDHCGTSFSRYEGVWTLADEGGRTMVTYTLSAKPTFSVPPFMLKRLLDGNARQTIAQLRAESALRAAREN
jgi:carbon monoxide dehydrogenase subunit G